MDHLLILLRLCIDLAFGFAFWGELRKLPRRSLPLFACPKKSNQKKRHPGSALLLRSSGAKARVPFLLPTFSLGKQRKVGRPTGRNKSVDEPTKRSERVRKSSASETASGIFAAQARSEEHTSELQSLMRISYAVFCLKKKNNTTTTI